MFTSQQRDHVRDLVLHWAHEDSRIVAGAVVGSLAHQPGDRWSDLDLAFAVLDGVPLSEVLDQWSDRLRKELDAVRLFDLAHGSAIYRVFLLSGCLQFDLSFAPASQFGAIGPNFRLLFGEAVEKAAVQPPSASDLFGHAVHHAVRARICIERARYWQAEYWISAARDNTLSLACLRRGLPAHYGRGFDDLPQDARDELSQTMVRSLDRSELLRALQEVVDALLREGGRAGDLARDVEARLREFVWYSPSIL